MSTIHVSVTVNGEAREADVEPRLLLVHLLRDVFGLTGTHIGCDSSNCGACTVHVDGVSAKACTMLAVQVDGREVKTIEGMAIGADPPSAAAGLLGSAWPAVRLLHAGHDHAVGLAPGAEPGPDRGRDPRRHPGQPVSLHGLRQHRQVDPAGGRQRCAPLKRRPSRRRRGDRDDRGSGHDHDLRSRGHGSLRQAQGGPALHPRQGRVHRRPGPAGHALAGHRAQPLRARQDPGHRQPPRRSRSPAWPPSSPARTSRATSSTGCRPWPATCRWSCPSIRSCTRARRWPPSSPPAATPPPTAWPP